MVFEARTMPDIVPHVYCFPYLRNKKSFFGDAKPTPFPAAVVTRMVIVNANICTFSVFCHYIAEYIAIFMVRYGNIVP